LQPTNFADPAYFHKVVDCQLGLPGAYPVPEYIRLIASGALQRCLHGQLGVQRIPRRARVAPATGPVSRPAGAAGSRRAMAQPEPVAICRLKRVAADMKDDIRNADAGHRTAQRQAGRLRGRWPGLADGRARPGTAGLRGHGVRRRGQGGRLHPQQIPRFRLPESVIDEETGYILNLGVEFQERAAGRVDEGPAGAGL
jgi:formate dehydrogenase beta subunit